MLSRTEPYDHCTMTVLDDVEDHVVDRFVELLLSMSIDDPEVRPLLQLEGLKQWRPGRTTGTGSWRPLSTGCASMAPTARS